MTTTLLGVDDSKTMRKVLEITFAGDDFRTVLAENAIDAMSKLRAERPSVVLVDAALDGTSGYDLCQRVKAEAPGVCVILLSSKQQPYDRSRGEQVGADDFIDKPFDTQQAIDKVVAALRRGSGVHASPQAAQAPVVPVVAPFVTGAQPGPRARTATLAYGSQFAPLGVESPVAPLVPPVSSTLASSASASIAVSSAGTSSTAVPAAARRPVSPVATSTAFAPGNGSELTHKLAALGLSPEQMAGVLALSREVVERVVWEVVPILAETLIKEEIRRLTSE